MSMDKVFEIEGITSFPAHSHATYRYAISLKDNKISIWLEDRSSKKQWRVEGLEMEDFICSSNAIPDAIVADYIQLFKASLDCTADDGSNVQRKLRAVQSGEVQLEMTIKFKVLQSSWSAKYAFELQPVSLAQIDVLEAKLRDQQEELKRLQAEKEGNDAEQAKYVCLHASVEQSANARLVWGAVESKWFNVSADGKSVVVLRAGLYLVLVAVRHFPQAQGVVSFELKKGDTCLQKDSVTNCSGYPISGMIQCTARFKAGDKLVVKHVGERTNYVQASFTAVGLDA